MKIVSNKYSRISKIKFSDKTRTFPLIIYDDRYLNIGILREKLEINHTFKKKMVTFHRGTYIKEDLTKTKCAFLYGNN